MSTKSPIVLLTPEARAALEEEVEHAGIGADLTGGLLFGHPLDERRRLVVSSVRLSESVGFGQKNFALDQTRTSRQLDHARSLDSEADYCGVWYIHRTPTPDLTVEELDQTENVIEDPDFHFKDLVCLVLCFYGGDLTIHAFAYDNQQVARGLPPVPTTFQVTTESSQEAAPQQPPTDWYKRPQIAQRLIKEHKRLATTYHAEPKPSSTGEVIFQVRPQQPPLSRHLTFYLACESGFPDEAPSAFLLADEKRHQLFCPALQDWTADDSLAHIADAVIEWLPEFLDEYMTRAKEALKREDYQEAADLLTVVLAVDPRTPGAARLLAKAQAPLQR